MKKISLISFLGDCLKSVGDFPDKNCKFPNYAYDLQFQSSNQSRDFLQTFYNVFSYMTLKKQICLLKIIVDQLIY